MLRAIATTAALGLAVCACNPQGGVTDPKVGQGIVSPSLDSGITSENGGGASAEQPRRHLLTPAEQPEPCARPSHEAAGLTVH